MSHFAALLGYCLFCCATTAMASNRDQWTSTTTVEKGGATQNSAIPKDCRSNVMQFPKHLIMMRYWEAMAGTPPVPVPVVQQPPPPAQP
jgi:hypothetical protein